MSPHQSIYILVLYFNLIINAWEFWYPHGIFNPIIQLIGFFIFFTNGIIIYTQGEPASGYLIMAAVFFIMEFFYIISVLIVWIALLIPKGVADEKNHEKPDWLIVFGFFGGLIALAVFKLYSATVCFTYKKYSKRKPEGNVLPEKYKIDHEECEVFVASYDSKTQYDFSQYPSQLPQYSDLHQQLPDMLPHYEDVLSTKNETKNKDDLFAV